MEVEVTYTYALGAAMHPFLTSKFTTNHIGNVLRNLYISFKMRMGWHVLVCQKSNVIYTVVFTGVIPCTTVSRNLCHVDFQYLIIHAEYGIITTYLCHRWMWIPYPPEDSRWDS